MKDHQLKALVQVADCGSIRAAARAMHLSPSALTKALRELEEDVGAELLTRSYKGVEFTPAGSALLMRARLVLATLDKARDEVRYLRGGTGAKITAAITPTIATTALPGVLKDFERLQPHAQLALIEGMMTSVIPALHEGSIDFAVVITDPEDLPHDMDFEPLVLVRGTVVGREGHPLADAQAWSELKDARWVLNLIHGSTGQHLLDWLERSGLERPVNPVLCTSPTLMLELTRHTDLIGFGPEPLFLDPMFSVGVQRFTQLPPVPSMSLGILTLRGVPLSAAARPLAELFARHIRQPTPAAPS